MAKPHELDLQHPLVVVVRVYMSESKQALPAFCTPGKRRRCFRTSGAMILTTAERSSFPISIEVGIGVCPA